MEHRRRGADFSDLIRSFASETTDCDAAADSAEQESRSSTRSRPITVTSNVLYNGNVKIITERSYEKDTSDSNSFKSTILAGQAAESDSRRTSASSYQTAGSNGAAVWTDASWSSQGERRRCPGESDRAANVEFGPRPELDLSRTDTDAGTSGEMNRNVDFGTDESSCRSRDTNYNIRGEKSSFGPKTYETDKKSQSSRINRRGDTPAPVGPQRKDTWSLLSTLDNVLDPSGDKTSKSKQKILKRLSNEFYHSPRTFTERLVTIIDESDNVHGWDEPSGVDLTRMTKEFRKMCKYIQDESMPEMAPSLCANSILGTSKNVDNEEFAQHEIPSTIPESPTDARSNEFATPPTGNDVSPKKIYRKTPLNMFKKTFRDRAAVGSPGSPNSTREFEFLEKQCAGSPSSPKFIPKNRSTPLRRSFSATDVAGASTEILANRCEQLVRSFDDDGTANCETFDSHRNYGPRVAKNDNAAEDAKTEWDELSNSLRIEKELQRQRCFETALLMQNIENETKNTNEEYPKALKRHGLDRETAFLDTISTCMVYQNCVSEMRKNSRTNRKDGSSVDSGIGTPLFGRTLCGSSKNLSDHPPFRNSQKLGGNYGSTLKDPKYETKSAIRSNSAGFTTGTTKKIQQKSVPTNNLRPQSSNVNKRSVPVTPRRNQNLLRPAAKSLARAKSPYRGKLSPSAKISTKTGFSGTSEKTAPNEIDEDVSIPEVIVFPSTPSEPTGRSNSRPTTKDNKGVSPRRPSRKSISPRVRSPRYDYSRNVGQSTFLKKNVSPLKSQRAKSPNRKFLTPSFEPSACSKNLNEERSPKITNCPTETEYRSAKTPEIPRHKFFVTPGRNVTVAKKPRTKPLFPNLDADIKERSELIMRSLHAPGLYRMGYKGVISPVNMYIHGTDVNLIHNNHERKNDRMLTPNKIAASEEKLRFALASKNSTPRNSPRAKPRNFIDKDASETDDNDENVRDLGFALPNAYYHQPARVQTVKQSPDTIRGGRTRELLRSVQNRVVIRHEGNRIGKYDDSEVPESCSDAAADMSVHVLKSAEKTNFISRRKL